MELFPRYVELKNTSRTFRRFEFKGYRGPAYCYLKVDIHDDVPVFFCVELIDQDERPLDSCLEEIRCSAIMRLIDDGLAVSTRLRHGLDHIARGRYARKRIDDVFEFFDERSLWVTHIPAEVHWLNRDSYSLNDFKRRFVDFMPREDAIHATKLDPSFFDVSRDELLFTSAEWQLAALSRTS